MTGVVRTIARAVLPRSLRRRMSRAAKWPPVGAVDLGDLRRIEPFSRAWGFDRGQPVDRWYIERFLSRESGRIRGRVLEVADDEYTRRYGGAAVTRSDVLHVVEGHPKATIVADLSGGEGIPDGAFDCVICTQTMQLIPDHERAARTFGRIVAPGGSLLLTMPGISQISRADMDQWGDYWRYTTASARRLFEPVFGGGNVTVEAHGNVLSSICFLAGLSVEELDEAELTHADPDYQMLITVSAVRPS